MNALKTISLLTLLALLANCSCSKNSTEPPPATLQLTVEPGVTEAWLTLSNPEQGQQLVLLRNGAEVLRFPAAAETTVVDTGLQPAHNYNYSAELWNNDKVTARSPGVKTTTMDTTSHNFTWEIDTIGAYGSYLLDVAIINENDIWAVGEIHTAETDTFDSLGNWIKPYNAIHWDGQQWELKHIYVEYRGQLTWSPLEGVFVLQDGQVIFSSGLPYLPEADHWRLFHLWDMGILDQNDGGVSRIWGTSLNNLFFVGRNGTIVHYNRPIWQQIQVPTTINLKDISGHGDWVAAVGYSDQSESIALGGEQLTIQPLFFSNSYFGDLPQGDYGRFSAVEVIGNLTYFVTKAGLLKYHFSGKQTLLVPAQQAQMSGHDYISISGEAPNDIMLTGLGGIMLHYNGKSWKKDRTILNHFGSGNIFLKSGQLKENLAIAVGYCCGFGHAIIARGYR